ncbi:MAG: hypothetical protein U1F98_17210 [Verrucomicrobiota bacterium]
MIPAARRTTWQGNVGVPGGIPYRTTIYTTLPAGATVAQINSALAACPSNQVVQLSAGTYTLNGTINMQRNGVTLRGATNANGQATTILRVSGGLFQGIYVQSPAAYDWDTPIRANHVSWVGGYAQGSTTITVASTNMAGGAASVPVGRLIFMDQLNDTNTSAVSVGGGAPGTGLYTSLAQPNVGGDRYQQQVARVTAVNGNTLTITPPLHMPNWSASLQPQIWWEQANPVEGVGVEDIWIQGVDTSNYCTYGIEYYNTYGCWARNVRVTLSSRHIYVELGSRFEARHCWIERNPGSGPSNYGFAIYHSSGSLLEDNIANAVQTPLLLCGNSGCVFSYNYMTNFLSGSWMWTGVSFHGNHNNMNLFEGNNVNLWSADNQWGSSIYNTAFRNRFSGHDEADTASYINNQQAICVAATNRFQNVVGNVLGTTGVNTYYEDASACGHETCRIYLIGNLNSYCGGGYDPIAYSSLLRAVNWDSANNGIVAGGFTTNDLPASYYLSAKPAWFGNLRWPPIDPASPAYSMSRTNLPAGYRFIYGVDPASGQVGNLPPPPPNFRVVTN